MTIPALHLHQKFGNPHRLVEFRVFSFNTCGAGCKNCFYQKSNNNYHQFDQVLKMAQEFRTQNYSLETCYILPTDVFENDFNFKIFENKNLQNTLRLFNYVGFASTLRNGFDRKFVSQLLTDYNKLKIELQVNLLEDLLFDPEYFQMVSHQIDEIRQFCQNRILVNLAFNTGTKLRPEQLARLKFLTESLSEDQLLELNFTFLFNAKIPRQQKAELLKNSYSLLQFLTSEFKKNETQYNDRTLLRKPSLFFKDGQIFISPIIPFDEYVFIQESEFALKQPDFGSFIEAYGRIERGNQPLWKMCDTCEHLKACHGKGFFSVASYFNLNCHKEGD